MVIAYLVVMLSFIDTREQTMPCRHISIVILDSLQNGFISKNDIRGLVEKKYKKILGYPLSKINTEELELSILKNRAIKKCDIYKTADGILAIEVIQRQPVLRVINNNNQSYYIDQEGYLIPFSSIQTPNVLVATGNIVENKPLNLSKHDHVDKFDKKGIENILYDLRALSAYIQADPFWKAQFVQLYVNKKGEIELIPRVGAHIIILGKTRGFEEKLKKLKSLYMNGLNNVGWNNYETINLKYKNQVICSKR